MFTKRSEGGEKGAAGAFVRGLHELEESGSPEALVRLFAEECEISNVAIQPLRGKSGVLRFWQDYRETFREVHTEFKSITESGGKAFLEWVSRGAFPSGRTLTYEGLTVLELQGERITRFKAYHDSAVFLKEVGNVEKPISTSEVMEGGPRRDISTPSEGVLTSTLTDRDAATG